jgi:hypothetical protein
MFCNDYNYIFIFICKSNKKCLYDERIRIFIYHTDTIISVEKYLQPNIVIFSQRLLQWNILNASKIINI